MEYNYHQLVRAFRYLDKFREMGTVNMFDGSRVVSEDLGHFDDSNLLYRG